MAISYRHKSIRDVVLHGAMVILTTVDDLLTHGSRGLFSCGHEIEDSTVVGAALVIKQAVLLLIRNGCHAVCCSTSGY